MVESPGLVGMGAALLSLTMVMSLPSLETLGVGMVETVLLEQKAAATAPEVEVAMAKVEAHSRHSQCRRHNPQTKNPARHHRSIRQRQNRDFRHIRCHTMLEGLWAVAEVRADEVVKEAVG
eukprot:scaffold274126_cov31-Tisochrysis_lutea.AAC.3